MRRQSSDGSNRRSYGLKPAVGATIGYWPDPRGPGHGAVKTGIVVDGAGDTVAIWWDDEPVDGAAEAWTAGDIRYRVDRGQMFVTPPKKQGRQRIPKDQLACKQCGVLRKVGCDCPRRSAPKPEEWAVARANIRLLGFPEGLTAEAGDDIIDLSHEGGDPLPDNMKGHMMAKKATSVKPVEEVDDLPEELDDEVETTPAASGKEMLSSKAAATLIGTDGRTLRKFLRKENGLVGQGQRWEIDPSNIEDLKARFLAWGGGKGSRSEGDKDKKESKSKTSGKGKVTTPPADDEVEELDDAELEAIEEIDDLDELDD